MPDIPEKHQKYDLLPLCRKYNHDCCIYNSRTVDELNSLLDEDNQIFPYGIESIEAYLKEVSEKQKIFEGNSYITMLFENYKKDILRLNDKSIWSVVRYVGGDALTEFTDGRCYYWPTDANGEYYGIIDDEEFTGYMHCTKSCYWEILEDPTGMAERIIKNESHSKENLFAGMSAEDIKKSLEDIGKQINNGVPVGK